MLTPTHRFATITLAVGAFVLLAAIALGEHMGDAVLGQAAEHALPSMPALASAAPDAPADSTPGPFGPDWKRSDTLSAAPDPRFPDPRIPPRPLPTPAATPKPTPTPLATPTPNPNIPIWRQQPLPTATPLATGTAAPTTSPLSP